MKKSLLTGCVLFMVSALFSQTNSASPGETRFINDSINYTTGSDLSTPGAVSSRFIKDYPHQNPTWTHEGANYRAEYVQNGVGRAITYDRSGNIISRDEQIVNGTYPVGISSYYSKNHPDEKFDVWLSTDANGIKRYYIPHRSEKVWFDSSGRYQGKSKSGAGSKKDADPNSK